jgi:hypothetical protein
MTNFTLSQFFGGLLHLPTPLLILQLPEQHSSLATHNPSLGRHWVMADGKNDGLGLGAIVFVFLAILDGGDEGASVLGSSGSGKISSSF